jgi:hypothetical protein
MALDKPTNIPGWFLAFRKGDWSIYYGSIRTAASVDFRVVCVLYSWSLIALACTVLIIGTRRSEVSCFESSNGRY